MFLWGIERDRVMRLTINATEQKDDVETANLCNT